MKTSLQLIISTVSSPPLPSMRCPAKDVGCLWDLLTSIKDSVALLGMLYKMADPLMQPSDLDPLVHLSLPLTKPLRVRRPTCRCGRLSFYQLCILFLSFVSEYPVLQLLSMTS